MIDRVPAPPDPLDDDAVAAIDRTWRRIVSEIGLRFDDPDARAVLAAAGQHADDDGVVRLDHELVADLVAQAPASFDVRGRDPAQTLRLGQGRTAFCAVYGAPFLRDGDVRRDATLDDFRRLVHLVDAIPELDTPGGVICEPNDVPLDSRHLEMTRALLAGTTKPVFGSVIGGAAAEDSIDLAALVHGGRAALAERPALLGIINVNSPLVYDGRMLEAMLALARAGQVPIVTPATMLGAMAPVTIAGALAQWLAEAFAGIALCQLVRPGTPVLLGSGVICMDMRTGAPSFGAPETVRGMLASGQLARRYGLPWRAIGGGLTSSTLPDAQAAYESAMVNQVAIAAGADLVIHAAGWLENGLVVSPEKLVLDVEILRSLAAAAEPIRVDPDELALDALREVGPGGHFLGATHTLARFRTCFYQPLVSSTMNHERWTRAGGLDATARAAALARSLHDGHVATPLDDAVQAALDEHVARRRRELGD